MEIHAEAPDAKLDAFIHALTRETTGCSGDRRRSSWNPAQKCAEFTIRESRSRHPASVRISADLPVCERCLASCSTRPIAALYPYINCTDCGPRFTIVEGLPYDRARTTMRSWPMDVCCEAQYRDPRDRRFHAQPLACPACGPHYALESGEDRIAGDQASIREAAARLRAGEIIATEGHRRLPSELPATRITPKRYGVCANGSFARKSHSQSWCGRSGTPMHWSS